MDFYILSKNLPNNPHPIGGKAINLSKLASFGFNVPTGFVILSDLHKQYQSDKTILTSIQNEIETEFLKFFSKNEKVVIRSSANYEDNDLLSFAGVYESVTNVTFSDLIPAIIKVYDSIDKEQALKYFKENNINKDQIQMAVIVQKQIDSIISGICFTKNPINGNHETIFEFGEGLNEAVVQGQKEPIRINFNQNDSYINNDQSEFADLLKLQIQTFKGIENKFGKPQDIEWAIDKNNKLFILQSRDITTIIKDINNTKSGEIIAQGISISGGTATGKLNFIDTSLSSQKLSKTIQSGDIIVAHSLRIDQLESISNVSGIIMSNSSILSHVAIRTRELKIPCVGGIVAINTLPKDEFISIDGTVGIVFKGKVDDIDIKSTALSFPEYYNFELLNTKSTKNFDFLYLVIDNKAMIYLPKIGNKEFIEEAISIMIKDYNLDKESIFVHKIGAWEGDNAPSVVYTQYKDLEKIKNNPTANAELDTILTNLYPLNIEKLNKSLEKLEQKAHNEFLTGLNLFDQFKESKNINLLEKSASHLDIAKNLSAILISTIIVEIFGRNYIEKKLKQHDNLSLTEVLTGTAKSDDKEIQQLLELSKMLTYFKNKEFETLSHDGTNFFNVIDYIYSNGYAEHVEKYRW